MLYLGIDQHAKQLTIDLSNENGDLLLHRQVKTKHSSLVEFLGDLRKQAEPEGGYMAIVEVCGFNNYLLNMLTQYGCDQVILVQPEERKKRKTDRRDARALRESLWMNRKRILESKRPANLRVVRPASEADAMDRQLTALRVRWTRHRTAVINKVQIILRKWNVQHDCPTKGIQTKKARAWLTTLELPEMDRFEMDLLLQQWDLVNEQLEQVNTKIRERQNSSPLATLLASIPGMSYFNSLSVACRIGDIEDFPRSGSLANFWGITPGSRNSGESAASLSITKAGSSHVRYVLGQVVLHVLRKDAWMRQWYQKIKRRRGSKIARVAVMRRLATIIWSMVKHGMPYIKGGPEKFNEYLRKHQEFFGEKVPA
jgi:transposase